MLKVIYRISSTQDIMSDYLKTNKGKQKKVKTNFQTFKKIMKSVLRQFMNRQPERRDE